MERKSPYVLVGAAMIVFIAAVVGFVIWKLRAGDRTSYAYYVIYFSGDVQGLTVDSPVYYRGLRVGRVHEIELAARKDIQRSTGRERLSEKVEVTVAVAWNVEIREGASFLQVTSTSAQELLSKAGTTVDRLNELLNPDNLTAVSNSLKSLDVTLAGIAKQDKAIQSTLAELPGAVAEFNKTFTKLNTV